LRPLFLSIFVLACSLNLAAQSNNIAGQFPLYNNSGYPDLSVDPYMVKDADVVDREFRSTSCELEEGSIGGIGVRRLLRFTTAIMNRGQLSTGVTIGHPNDVTNPYYSWFVFDVCHQHYHLRDFSKYELVDGKGKIVAAGHKQSFCIEDVIKYNDKVSNPSRGYDCGDNWWTPGMGITAGWGDVYEKAVSGQWIDITGVPGGTYVVRISINVGDATGSIISEGENRYPDVLEFKVSIPAPSKKVPVLVCGDVDLVCY
jgi:lysyl oxidase